MKLIKANITNFRLLKEIEINFSTSEGKNITMIRAANESGKTTLLSALQWGLFGDDGLPNQGRDYRITPIDFIKDEQVTNTEVSVEIVFEVPLNSGTEKFRILRFANESIRSGQFNRENSKVSLTKISQTGDVVLKNPESNIRRFLPFELREIFFTDGDRALQFIQGKRSEKKKRIEDSIKSLLGLNIVQDSLSHIQKVAGNLNSRIKQSLPEQDHLNEITTNIDNLNILIPQTSEALIGVSNEVEKLEELEKEADRRLVETLKKGNKDELVTRKKTLEDEWSRTLRSIKSYKKEHSELFKNKIIAKGLLSSHLVTSNKRLDQLKKDKRIPSQTIPVLEKYLESDHCICGDKLDENNSEGISRRKTIENLIKESREEDVLNAKLSDLYYSSRDFVNSDAESWDNLFQDIFKKKNQSILYLQKVGTDLRELEAKLDKLPDVDVSQIKLSRDTYRKDLDSKKREENNLIIKLKSYESSLKEFIKERETLLQKDSKGKKILSEIIVAEDLAKILENSLETLRTREIEKVSEMMNSIFLEMIGADNSQRAIINKATLSKDYQILVYGESNHLLNPIDDLNGASRRALTLSFILALTQVSQVEAPNVIDTPLGMMSGYVKRSVLFNSAQLSSQLILLLTHSEIKDCEDILDEKVGASYTLTSPAHYPAILVNSPVVDDLRVMVCDCNHNKTCSICERNETIEYFG